MDQSFSKKRTWFSWASKPRAVVEVRKDCDPEKVLNALYKYSDLQVTFGVNMVAIAEGKPVQMGIKAMIGYYIDHQKNVVTRRTQYELQQAEARAHIHSQQYRLFQAYTSTVFQPLYP